MVKKLFLLIAITIAAMSCEGPMGPPGKTGAPGEDGEDTNWKIKYYTVFDNEWELVGGPGGINSYYTAIVYDDDITQFIYDEGAFMVYQIQNYNQSNEVQTALPFVLPMEDDGGSGYAWTETIAYDYQPGSIAFYVNYSDFRTDLRSPGTLEFKATMMW